MKNASCKQRYIIFFKYSDKMVFALPVHAVFMHLSLKPQGTLQCVFYTTVCLDETRGRATSDELVARKKAAHTQPPEANALNSQIYFFFFFLVQNRTVLSSFLWNASLLCSSLNSVSVRI